MKKVIFAAIAAAVMCASCSNSNASANASSPTEEKFEKGIFTTSQTEMVEIAFQDGESPYFEISMRTGSEKDNIVWASFYKASDVDQSGRVKSGAVPCRYYQIVIPPHEIAKKWGYGPIITQREDGSEHIIKLNLVNQPD